MDHALEKASEQGVLIHSTLAPKINLAFHQNSLPFVRELEVVNDLGQPLQQVQLTVSSDPPFLKPRTWRIDSVAPGQRYRLNELDLALDGALLGRLIEAEAAEVLLVLRADGSELARQTSRVDLLARDQWGGIGQLPELIAAFVQPNDPAVDRLLKRAAEILRRHGKDAALDGYTGGPQRAWELTSAIWAAVGSLGLDYALPAASFERTGQKIRGPSRIVEAALATCLDITLLVCAALEQCGLNPLVILGKGHAFAGVWLKAEEFSSAVVDDVTALRKRIKLQELVLFETTLLTQRPCPRFSQGVERGASQISEAHPDGFELAVDVRRARLQRIRPLAGAEAPATPAAPEPEGPTEPLFEPPPDLPDEEIAEPAAEGPAGPEDRVDHWQRKLLDLSLRNSLLNFRATRRAIQLDAPEPGRLEDLLADGEVLKVLPRPDLMGGADPRSQAIHEARTHEDLRREHALDALKRKEVFVGLSEDDLAARLVELYRSARAATQDGGANTLYLALGFLRWTRDKKDDKTHRAPLILVPVTLQRKSVRSGFTLSVHEDEPRFNPTLLEMLRQDFGLSIAVGEGELPKDESGLDVDGIWKAVARAVKDIKGWEVSEDVVLSTFSFAKYLMWKDLVERTAQLKQSPVVRHLIDTPRDPYASTIDFPDPRQLDQTLGPEQTFCPLPADSSQLSAVVAAAQGKDYVLIGPPGTGKSQTIANLIAQCLAEKKTALFVSAKIAALDVVYRRLRDVGLGDFCLELHSSKARKLDVLRQLENAWDAKGGVDAEEWRKEASRLKGLRDQLNAFVEHLHRRRRNGLTAYQAIGRVVADQELPALGLAWPSADAHDADALAELRELAGRLGINAAEVGDIATSALRLIAHADWSPSWQQALVKASGDLLPVASELERSATALQQAIGLPELKLARRVRDNLGVLARELPKAAGKRWGFVLRQDAAAIAEGLLKGDELLAQHRRVTQQLSVEYADSALGLDLGQLKSDWIEAEQAWLFKAWLIRRRVRKALSQTIGAKEIGDLAGDLDRLMEIKALRRQIAALDPLRTKTEGLWNGLKTHRDELVRALGFQQAVLAAIGGLAATPAELAAAKAPIERLLTEAGLLLEPGGYVAVAGITYLEDLARFQKRLEHFVGLAGRRSEGFEKAGADTPAALVRVSNRLIELQPKLHAWCAWRQVRSEAMSQGLNPLVRSIEHGTVAPDQAATCFEADYCRWWLNATVDQDEVLRGFVSAVHEQRIMDFRALDEQFTELTRAYVRSGLCGELPDQDQISRSSEWGILRHEMQKKKRHMPLRELIGRIPTALGKLSPCLLMSPLSIAQYLSADTAAFDVVVFDEASQIPVWDAIGAMARGRRVVMVGDPKQLPPTSFFDKAGSTDDDEDVEGDLESILDECLGANLPTLSLNWHYRSRHESLIAFSNHRYYGGGLVTFPSPVTEDRAVNLNLIADGVYEKGGARINKPEARALVADLVAHLRDPAFRDAGYSIGVVTFNSEQQRLIEDLLDAERRNDPDLEPCFAEDALEPVLVKNLESVQGDERDLMYFSVTFGPDLTGATSMNLGPMNRDGGERRLNVAVTRARRELRVFSSLRPEQIDLSRTGAEGVRDLKHFLEFAERGPQALAQATTPGLGTFESPFEEAVAARLAAHGWLIHPQIGVSSFRIDLGVVDPDAPGSYLAGIECDGATYHRSATARDRDQIREQMLRGLGWEILRIWSTDWWHDAQGALDKIHSRLEVLLEQARARRTEEARQREEAARAVPSPIASVAAASGPGSALTADGAGSSRDHSEVASPDLPEPAALYARPPASHQTAVTYELSDLAALEAEANPDVFFERAYDQTLKAMIAQVVASEGPIREDLLATRIARAHGWSRTGARIRGRVARLVTRAYPTTREPVGLFVWPPSSNGTFCEVFRRPGGDGPRSVDEVPMPELEALAREVLAAGLTDDEAVAAMARESGLKKLRQASRERIEAALAAATGS